jgi:alpha-L-rhamnosidase
MITAIIALFIPVVTMDTNPTAQSSPAPDGLAAPANLRCEYLVDPVGIDQTAPRLSWEMIDSRRSAVQQAYRILVADAPDLLGADVGNLWDTGTVTSDQSIQVVYAGRPLRPRTRAYWKVRVWDKHDHPSPWSSSAHWTMGLLERSDWEAKWIGDSDPPPPVTPANNGYHSEFASSPDTRKWVMIDLGESVKLDGIRLHPARPYDWKADVPGFLFPLRFKIELSNASDFTPCKTVVDRTLEDVPNPGAEPQTYEFPTATGRFVRLTVTRLRLRDAGQYGFALAEMEILADGKNLALGKTVAASDSIEWHAWSTKNLVDGDLVSHGIRGVDPLPPPMLRNSFKVAGSDGAIKQATVYVTALGLYELRINGQRVGDHVLAPEWTDYHKRVQYQTYDVTPFLRNGDNAIGVLLGDGWYAGKIGLTGIVPGGLPRAIYGRQPRLLLQMEIEFADGRSQTIVSDETWRSTTDGPIRRSDLLDGEVYDARREMPGWDAPGFDDSSWKPVRVFAPTDARLVAQPNEPVRIVMELKPIRVTEPRAGVYVFDMGQNMVGWCRLKVRGSAGTTVTLRHAEVLNADGTIYTENLRSAAQTDRYTLRGDSVELLEPHFTYHGFRYVEATGLTEPPMLDSLVGCVFHSSAPLAGEFECSSPMLNRLMQNIVWTQWANLQSIPTDCPQRDERLGWMGDILAFAQTACFNMDMAAFFSKWMRDVRDAQADDGRFPDFAPHPYDPSQRCSGAPAWGDAGVSVPWCVYRNYGDKRMLEEHFDAARHWVDYVHARNPDLLWRNARGNDYGDWLNADTLRLEGWPRTGAARRRSATRRWRPTSAQPSIAHMFSPTDIFEETPRPDTP